MHKLFLSLTRKGLFQFWHFLILAGAGRWVCMSQPESIGAVAGSPEPWIDRTDPQPLLKFTKVG